MLFKLLNVFVSINLISLPTPSIIYVITVCVVATVKVAPLPDVDVTVIAVGVTPSPISVLVSSTPVIAPLPFTLVTLPMTTVAVTILSLTAYPVPPPVKLIAVTVCLNLKASFVTDCPNCICNPFVKTVPAGDVYGAQVVSEIETTDCWLIVNSSDIESQPDGSVDTKDID